MTPRVQGLLDDWSKHPLGTADAGKMQQACEVRMTHHQELFNFYAVKSDARLKFLTAQRDQRMMDQEVNRILKLDRPIAFGDGSDGFSPNGKPGGPVKRFMGHLQRKGGRVIVVDEYKTSKCCWQCGEETVPFRTKHEPTAHRKWRERMAERGEPVDRASSFQIHGLRTCKLCRKTLNKDVNAALNMATVGVCQVFGEKHPFRRCGANTDE